MLEQAAKYVPTGTTLTRLGTAGLGMGTVQHDRVGWAAVLPGTCDSAAKLWAGLTSRPGGVVREGTATEAKGLMPRGWVTSRR